MSDGLPTGTRPALGAVVGVLVLALAPSARAGPRIEAAFTAPSGRPGEVAVLRIAASPTRSLTLEAIRAAAEQRTPAAAVPSPTAAPWAPRRLRLAGRAPGASRSDSGGPRAASTSRG